MKMPDALSPIAQVEECEMDIAYLEDKLSNLQTEQDPILMYQLLADCAEEYEIALSITETPEVAAQRIKAVLDEKISSIRKNINLLFQTSVVGSCAEIQKCLQEGADFLWEDANILIRDLDTELGGFVSLLKGLDLQSIKELVPHCDKKELPYFMSYGTQTEYEQYFERDRQILLKNVAKILEHIQAMDTKNQ